MPTFLAALSQSLQPFNKHPALRDTSASKLIALQALIWLLREDIVVQMHVRMRLIATADIKQQWRERKEAARKERRRAQRRTIDELSISEKNKDSDAASDALPATSVNIAAKQFRGRPRERSRSVDAKDERTRLPEKNGGQVKGRERAQTAAGQNPAVEELRFERRQVLRSRSPSRLLAELSGTQDETSSRSNTPRGRRRYTHTVDKAVIGSYGTVYSEPGTGVGASRFGSSFVADPAARNSSRPAARSPSKARMTIKGFGADEERAFDEAEEAFPSGDVTAREEGADAKGGRAPRSDEATERDAPDTGDDVEGEEDLDASSEEGWELISTEASLIVEPSRASREEDEWIAIMTEDKEEWLSQQFYRCARSLPRRCCASARADTKCISIFRLLPYLNGKHTLDEIAHREELRRRELRAVIEAYRAYIITFVHP